MEQNEFSGVLMTVKRQNDRGYVATVNEIAAETGESSDNVRNKTTRLTEKGLLEKIILPGRYNQYGFRIPGRNVAERRPAWLDYHVNKDPLSTALTKEKLMAFCREKIGAETEYMFDSMQTATGRKVILIQPVKVVGLSRHVVILSNGHTCLPVELWWWFKRHQVIGTGPNETYLRRLIK